MKIGDLLWTVRSTPYRRTRLGHSMSCQLEQKKNRVKWVYKTKYNELGDIDKHKARLSTKGYSQKHGIDYTEIFALVARLDTVRMIIALAVQKSWKIF